MYNLELIVRERIEKEKREQTGSLQLGNCELTALPEAVREMIWLEKLFLINNSIIQLPDWFSELVNLKYLTLDHNPISSLAALSGLTLLQDLDCNVTNVADLSPLSGLSQLESISCIFSQVENLSPLSGLTKLRSLNFSCTAVVDLLPLSELYKLQSLFCMNTPIKDLWPLSRLTSLEQLNCVNTKIVDLSPLSELSELVIILCSGTQVADLSPLTRLYKLKALNCYNTHIADLSPLSNLAELKHISCQNTKVTDLSALLFRILSDLPVRCQPAPGQGIFVADCPLVIPPVEFAIEGPEAVVEYFEQLGDERQPLNEVKVIFLGEGAAGKTSLIKRLRGETFDPEESQTHGIRIKKTPFDLGGETVTARCWDFGGQEVNHATHQFFLSQRCVYVVVLNARSDDKAEKWLKHAASFGGRSPVLVVLNKIDENPSFEVNRKLLIEKYPNIRDFFRLSCGTGQGVAQFRDALQAEIERADARRTPFPAGWRAVKDHFAHMTEDYIDSAQFRAVCEANGVTRRFSQDVLLQFLHDLGVVINFRNLKNFDTQILNPLWLTNGVYRIINSERVANAGGLLGEDEFDAVINDPRYDRPGERKLRYPLDKLNYIVRVMQEFELCYRLDGTRYVVPQLLPVAEPDFQAQGKGLSFVIHFPEFLPDSVFPRLMVKLHDFILGELRWRTGMVLSKPTVFDACARVREDKEDKALQIDARGNEPRRFLSFIRATVKEIVDGFAHLPITERVPIPDCGAFLDYEDLAEAEQAGEKEVFVRQLKKRVPISELLDGVEEPEMRGELAQMPVKAFISYSHKDKEHLPDLRAALSPLVRLNKLILWDDRDIEAGEEWNKEIFRELDEADLVLCLVSADFINSDFCYTQELAAALEAHRRGEKTVVPIRLRECNWDGLPLAQLQGIPGAWISSARDKDVAWKEVSKSLEPAISHAKERKVRILAEKRLG